MSFISLSLLDVGIAALLLVMNALLSLILNLGLAKKMMIAATRMVVQLLLLGLVLKVLFNVASPVFTSAMGLVMILFSGREVVARQSRLLTGWWTYGLGTTSMLIASTVVTLFALTTQVRPDPWYEARVALPLLGMILGNTMTGIALGLDRLLTSTVIERHAIEARLTLGHSITEAMSGVVRDALRSGLLPIINSMSAVGLVSIPGMMTGQILAGIEPMEAAKYQLLIMFLIAGGTTLGVLGSVLAGGRRLRINATDFGSTGYPLLM